MYTKEERIELYNKAEQKWGKIAQYDQCIEEMGELIVAINKMKRKNKFDDPTCDNYYENLVEEICDVFVCVEQLVNFVGQENVEKIMQTKLDKLKNKL